MKTNPSITDETIIVAVPDQLTCDLAGDAAILHLPDGLYYGLNETGAFVWERLQQPIRVADLYAAFLQTFDVAQEVATRDLYSLLDELLEAKLIQACDALAS